MIVNFIKGFEDVPLTVQRATMMKLLLKWWNIGLAIHLVHVEFLSVKAVLVDLVYLVKVLLIPDNAVASSTTLDPDVSLVSSHLVALLVVFFIESIPVYIVDCHLVKVVL